MDRELKSSLTVISQVFIDEFRIQIIIDGLLTPNFIDGSHLKLNVCAKRHTWMLIITAGYESLTIRQLVFHIRGAAVRTTTSSFSSLSASVLDSLGRAGR